MRSHCSCDQRLLRKLNECLCVYGAESKSPFTSQVNGRLGSSALHTDFYFLTLRYHIWKCYEDIPTPESSWWCNFNNPNRMSASSPQSKISSTLRYTAHRWIYFRGACARPSEPSTCACAKPPVHARWAWARLLRWLARHET